MRKAAGMLIVFMVVALPAVAQNWLGYGLSLSVHGVLPSPASSPTSTGSTPPSSAPGGLPGSILPIPDDGAGTTWHNTFDDEFNGTTIDTTKWNGEYGGGLQWCGSCPQNYAGLTVANGILTIAPSAPGAANSVNGINSGGPTAAQAHFSQRYGYFEYRIQLPADCSGCGDSYGWYLPIGKSGFNASACGGPTDSGMEEVDFPDQEYSDTPASDTQTGFYIHDQCQNEVVFAVPTNVQAFHLYGLYWRNNGTAHGSMQGYIDGKPVGSPHVLDSLSALWGNGIYMLIGNAGEANNGAGNVLVDWVRVYNEQ